MEGFGRIETMQARHGAHMTRITFLEGLRNVALRLELKGLHTEVSPWRRLMAFFRRAR
jgi:hypothetical protein